MLNHLDVQGEMVDPKMSLAHYLNTLRTVWLDVTVSINLESSDITNFTPFIPH